MSKKWVYLFTEVAEAEKYVGGKWDDVRALLGGKGANLFEMTRIGLPVPPGFTVTTEACNAYLANGGQVPRGHVGAGTRGPEGHRKGDRQDFRRPQESPPRLLPLGLEGIDARHDGHRPEHRPQRRRRSRAWPR